MSTFVVLLATAVISGMLLGLYDQHVYVLALFIPVVAIVSAVALRNFDVLAGAFGIYGCIALGEIAYVMTAAVVYSPAETVGVKTAQ